MFIADLKRKKKIKIGLNLIFKKPGIVVINSVLKRSRYLILMKKVAYLEKWCLSLFQIILFKTSYTHLSIPYTFQNSLQNLLLGLPNLQSEISFSQWGFFLIFIM